MEHCLMEVGKMALTLLVVFLAVVGQATFSKAYDVTVTQSTNSALLQWKTIQDSFKVDFLQVICNGTRHYTSKDGQQLLDTTANILRLPPQKDHVLIEDLPANFNYSCTLWEYFAVDNVIFHRESSEPVQFKTGFGAPEKPEKPEIQKQGNSHTIKIMLYSTSTRFGPISGYQVQFHVVEKKSMDNFAVIDDQLLDPFSPLSTLISKEEAQNSPIAKSFWIDFKGETLPNNIVIDESLLEGALKSAVEYSIVTVAYTHHEEGNESIPLFTPSEPSTTFKTYSRIRPAYLDANDPTEFKVIIALIVVLPSMVIGFICSVGIIVLLVKRRRRKNLKKKYSRRDVVAALAMRQADQHGIHIAFYGSARQLGNVGDLPWLDPFSALERRLSTSQISQGTGESSGVYYELPAISTQTEEQLNRESSGLSSQQPSELHIAIDFEQQASELEISEESHAHISHNMSEDEILARMSDHESVISTTDSYSEESDIWVTPNISPEASVTMLRTNSLYAPVIGEMLDFDSDEELHIEAC